ncbi:fimbrial protein PefA [Yokenella regensburgei]|uniref:fimbrial protein PefA n=1 Tax=Yokenella regensburgei TaxID=158877 RepID=UPI0027D962B0|nr:fimbrial protein PefA [Yokenella regensburgei]MDQ4429064.1 fimbrial protein PefA [Yokenella regensburgei]
MKHNIMLISSLALAVMSGSAMADINGGTVQFTGVVSNTTCDIGIVSNGSSTGVIDLGTAGTTEDKKTAATVNFILQPTNACVIIPDTTGGAAGTQANVSFTGNFDSMGLKPTSGSATDARVLLTATNSITPNSKISKSNNTVPFQLAELNKGASFNAVLQAGMVPGDYHSSLVYAVTYK